MELRQLRYFLSVADTRSFVSAASKLFISRQAVSKAVSQLEGELGVELFMRDSNGAFLTPAGIMFYERVRVLVMELEDLCSDMQGCGTRFQQKIRLAFSTGAMRIFEERLLGGCSAQENMNIYYQECPEDMCMQLLHDNKVDMVISTVAETDPAFASIRVAESPFGILFHEKHALVESMELSKLVAAPLAIHSDCSSRNFCQKFSLIPRYQGYDFHRLFRLVEEGMCLLLLPRCLAPDSQIGLRWSPILDVPSWELYKTYHRIVEKNQLYSAALDELNLILFQEIK